MGMAILMEAISTHLTPHICYYHYATTCSVQLSIQFNPTVCGCPLPLIALHLTSK